MTLDEHAFPLYNMRKISKEMAVMMIPTIDPEFKALIPPLSPEEREQLEQNILASRKCHDPLVIWNGVVLDGHNRFSICIRHGIEFQIEEIMLDSREEAKAWIIDNQLSRRNLSDVARIEMSLLKADLLREKAQRNLSIGGRNGGSKPLPFLTKPKIEATHVQKETAAEASVSKGKLCNYLQIKEQGSPELLAKVQSGEIKIGKAHRLLPKELMKQLNHAGKMLKFIQDARPPEGYEVADPEIHANLVKLAAQMRTLLERLENNHEDY